MDENPFVPDFLSSLSFTTGGAGVTFLKALALRNGFKLSCRDSMKGDTIRLQCHRGSRNRGKSKTTKTDCPFTLKLRKHDAKFIIMPQCTLEHNHPMLTSGREQLPDEVESCARSMLAVGIARPLILAFIQERTGRFLTRQELSNLFEAESVDAIGTESADLIAHVETEGGMCYPFDIPSGDDFVRAAVFTLTAIEATNLERFGDVLFLDGTAIRNAMGWTTVPVTLVDDSKEILSGGLLFTAFEREEIYLWFIQTLHIILANKLRTIFTDEDSALVSAIVRLQVEHPEIAHRLCVFHKRRNFEARVRSFTRDARVSTEAGKLFDEFVYGKTEDIVEQAIEQLRKLIPELVGYIDSELRAYIPHLTEAFRGEALTLGYHSTGVSESSNHMLLRNLPAATHTLTDIRQGFSRAHQIKAATRVEKITRQFQIIHFLEKDFGVKLHRPICHWIDRLVAQSKVWHTQRSDEFGVYESHYNETIWLLRYDGETAPQCQCNETSATALPCPHMIALFREIGGPQCFPVQMIAPRWIPNFNEIEMPTLPALQIEEHDQMLRALSNVSSDSEQEEGPGMEGRGDDSEFPDTVAGRNETTTERYRRVLYIGKEIAQKASRNEERYDGIVEALRHIRDSLSEVVSGEIRDAVGKPKGRPRGRGHSRPGPIAPKRCPLCDSAGHNLIDCRYYAIFRSEQGKFSTESQSKMHCKLCGHPGHRKNTCPVLRISREKIREDSN